MASLKDKVAIVAGASSGIGAAIVRKLLELGMKVVGLARRKERVEQLGKGYEKQLFALKTDITIERDILDAIAWTQKNVGPIYLLVNCAGVGKIQILAEAESSNWKAILDTNLLALTLFTKEVIKVMRENKTDGIIININSVAGHYVANWPGLAVYQASKFGVTAFTEGIRRELAAGGSKIRITSLSPGLVETDMAAGLLDKNPFLKGEDVANGIKYIITQPPNVNIGELTIRPTAEIL